MNAKTLEVFVSLINESEKFRSSFLGLIKSNKNFDQDLISLIKRKESEISLKDKNTSLIDLLEKYDLCDFEKKAVKRPAREALFKIIKSGADLNHQDGLPIKTCIEKEHIDALKIF